MNIYVKKIVKRCIRIRDKIYFYIANILLPIYYTFSHSKYGLNTEENRERKIIISMTSFPDRMDKINLCIEGLLHQTYKPDKIILYLAKEQFEGIEIPNKLIALKKRGLEIKFCEDLKPHKKYFYAMQEYSNDIVITVDDDAFYRRHLVEKLMHSYKKYPNSISCTRSHMITFDKNNRIKPYNMWDYESKYTNKPSMFLLATGVGGVLYPPKCMNKELFNKTNIIDLCLYADDIWLKAMQILNNISVVAIPSSKTRFCIGINGAEDVSLFKSNVHENRNDMYIEKVFNQYNITYENFINSDYILKNNLKGN